MALGQGDVERLAHELHDSEAALRPAGEHAGGVGDDDVVVGREVGDVADGRVEVAGVEGESGHPVDRGQQPRQQHLTAGREDHQRHLTARLGAELLPQRLGALDRSGNLRRGAGQRAAR